MSPATVIILMITTLLIFAGCLAFFVLDPSAQVGTQVRVTTACHAPPAKFLQAMPHCLAVGALVNGTSISFTDACDLKDGQNATLTKQSSWPFGLEPD
jgi:hypothetical protein